jgi:hypothetical protein
MLDELGFYNYELCSLSRRHVSVTMYIGFYDQWQSIQSGGGWRLQ